MFDRQHYVPVLRWKRAECVALKELAPEVKVHITPLIEFLPAKLNIIDDAEFQKNLSNTCDDIAECWGEALAFIDLRYCPRRATTVLSRLLSLVQGQRLNLAPVINLNQDTVWRDAVKAYIEQTQTALCIRISCDDLQRPSLVDDINRILSSLQVSQESVHLIVDCGLVTTQRSIAYQDVLSRIPHLNAWLTLSMISGAFPKDLTGFRPGIHTHQRLDWISWREQVLANGLIRVPVYGDFTIQHPHYSEPPERANISASIRYAANDYWVIMRGEGLFNDNSPGFSQYPAQAALLREQTEFLGGNFSAGDKYIDDMGQQVSKKGTPEYWLRAGINHHMTLTVSQLANLAGI